jgi:hypothetical protein
LLRRRRRRSVSIGTATTVSRSPGAADDPARRRSGSPSGSPHVWVRDSIPPPKAVGRDHHTSTCVGAHGMPMNSSPYGPYEATRRGRRNRELRRRHHPLLRG